MHSPTSFLYQEEPEWFSSRPGIHQNIPLAAQSWIYEPGSLTQRLRSIYGNEISVQILFHTRQKPFLSERRMLDLPHSQYSLIREVRLNIGNTPLILARTIIPTSTLKGARRILSRLGNRPLGEVIFSYPKLHRLEMDIALIEPDHWSDQLSNQVKIDQPIWGRRTVYAIKHKQLLVSEFFLPEILKHP